MTTTYDNLLEVSEILETIKDMKNKTLDFYHEDKKLAKMLLIELNKLEKDTENLISQFNYLL